MRSLDPRGYGHRPPVLLAVSSVLALESAPCYHGREPLVSREVRDLPAPAPHREARRRTLLALKGLSFFPSAAGRFRVLFPRRPWFHASSADSSRPAHHHLERLLGLMRVLRGPAVPDETGELARRSLREGCVRLRRSAP